MVNDGTRSHIWWGIASGLLIALGLSMGIAAYISGPGRLPLRTVGITQGEKPLPSWPDPNARMQYPQDRLALAELIRIQDEENAALRGNAAKQVSTANESDLHPENDAIEGEFDIEFRPTNHSMSDEKLR